MDNIILLMTAQAEYLGLVQHLLESILEVSNARKSSRYIKVCRMRICSSCMSPTRVVMLAFSLKWYPFNTMMIAAE
jgi:hypothetical protein